MPSSRDPAEGRGAGRVSYPGARQSTLRETNLRLVAQTVFEAATPPSRADVAVATGMTRSTVSRLVDELVNGGLLAELAPTSVSRPGRPATPLVPESGTIAALGLQVSPGFLAAVVVDLAGAVLAHRRMSDDLVGSQPEPVLARLGALGREVLGELAPHTRVAGAGLALPGIVRTDDGRLLRAPNLGWSDVDAVSLLGELREPHPPGRSLPVRAGNEAELAAWTVAYASPGRRSEHTDFLYVSGEIGIGGAVVFDGRIISGRHGWAGEIGHVCVDPNGPPCRCGSTGCLEQYVGVELLRDILPERGTHARALNTVEAATALAQRAQEGDQTARRIVQRATWALSVALAGVVNVVDIPTIVLGGHLAPLAALMGDDLATRLSGRVLSGRWVPPRIVVGPAGEDCAAAGAALRELEPVLAAPARWLPAHGPA